MLDRQGMPKVIDLGSAYPNFLHKAQEIDSRIIKKCNFIFILVRTTEGYNKFYCQT